MYWLLEGDAKRLATQVSCHQDIAETVPFHSACWLSSKGPCVNEGLVVSAIVLGIRPLGTGALS